MKDQCRQSGAQPSQEEYGRRREKPAEHRGPKTNDLAFLGLEKEDSPQVMEPPKDRNRSVAHSGQYLWEGLLPNNRDEC